MNKVFLIIRREYLSRVKKKSFIVMTFVVPILVIGMYGTMGYLMAKSDELGDAKNVTVVDENGMFRNNLKNVSNIKFSYTDETYDKAKAKVTDKENAYLLHIPASLENVEILSEKKAGASMVSSIEDQMNNLVKNHKLVAAGIDTAVLRKAQSHLEINAKQITAEGEKDADTLVAYGVAFLCAFLVYMSLFIYGAQVMRGVIEEKTSRVIEVIISSVKPFQLMLGKIIGIGMVGLTQFLLWIILTITLTGVAGTMVMKGNPAQVQQTMMQASPAGANSAVAQSTLQKPDKQDMKVKIMQKIQQINVTKTVLTFLFYFLFGYFIYSAVFAIVGSAVDNETETQQFMLPITLPLIFTFILSISFVINNPDSPLSVWLSLIPFTSPVAMMVRLQFDVPAWQLALSMGLLLAGFVFTTWVAARIYRVGILMYGKKASYRELVKWFFYKE
ncbi:MAG: ABC transporter permease [Bacteroidetes bacterium]|nr:ABC transporter permease [Bacteroidota bacterium]